MKNWVSKTKHQFFKDGFQKPVQHWRKCIEMRGDFVEKLLCFFENNLCRHIFFYFIKISFPVQFLSKWRKNFSARQRI
jgi:hypothetical protein